LLRTNAATCHLPREERAYIKFDFKTIILIVRFKTATTISLLSTASPAHLTTTCTTQNSKSKFKTIFLLYDLDSAGIRASKKIKLEFPDIRVLLLPRSKGCKDCSDFIKKHGKQEFLKLINELKEKFGFS
jgi:5S rRNA maturation endonuclease (ribonuclease M5)